MAHRRSTRRWRVWEEEEEEEEEGLESAEVGHLKSQDLRGPSLR
jgi:hypothetical protein